MPPQPSYGRQVAGRTADLATARTAKTPVGEAPVVPVILMAVGGYLLWYSIHYWKQGGWPTTPVKSVLQGKGLPPSVRPPSEAETLRTATGGAAGAATAATAYITSGGNVVNTVPPAVSSGTGTLPTGSGTAYNINVGKLLAAKYGWGPGSVDWPYLESGWQEESGWSTTAAYDHADPYNHAYGIPQANPGTKMASAGADWKTNPATQISWGLKYIHDTYGAPSRVPHWSPHGPTAGYVGY